MGRWFGLCGPVALVMLVCAGSAVAAEPRTLLNVGAPGAELRLKPTWGSDPQVSVSQSQNPAGVIVSIRTGQAQYPGVIMVPEGAASWDLSAFNHVEARVVNTGSKPAVLAMRVDNNAPGQSEPSNSEQISLAPGEAGTVSVEFGRSYGHKPGYALKPNAVVAILMFMAKADVPQSFRIERLVAAGPGPAFVPTVPAEKPKADPDPGRVKPKGGVLLGAPGAGADGGVRIVLPEGNSNQAAAVKPGTGRWDLHDATGIRVTLKNEGTASITPRVQVTSDGNGATDAVPAGHALAPGEECEIVVPFAASARLQGTPDSTGQPGPTGQAGNSAEFRSDSVTSVRIMAERTGSATLLVKSIVVTNP